MAWSVEHSRPKTTAENKAGPPQIPVISMALRGREEALQVARLLLEQGDTVWCIKDDTGSLVMNRSEAWRAIYGDRRPRP